MIIRILGNLFVNDNYISYFYSFMYKYKMGKIIRWEECETWEEWIIRERRGCWTRWKVLGAYIVIDHVE